MSCFLFTVFFSNKCQRNFIRSHVSKTPVFDLLDAIYLRKSVVAQHGDHQPTEAISLCIYRQTDFINNQAETAFEKMKSQYEFLAKKRFWHFKTKQSK